MAEKLTELYAAYYEAIEKNNWDIAKKLLKEINDLHNKAIFTYYAGIGCKKK